MFGLFFPGSWKNVKREFGAGCRATLRARYLFTSALDVCHQFDHIVCKIANASVVLKQETASTDDL